MKKSIVLLVMFFLCPICWAQSPVQKTVTTKLILPKSTVGIIEAGKKFPGAHVCESKMHPLLMAEAQKQAEFQAKVCVQGHQNWNARFNMLRVKMPGYIFSEICAESWKRQQHETMYNLGWEMFKCWKYSSGHWSVASKKHMYYGAGMAMGRNGIWYGCIIVGNK